MRKGVWALGGVLTVAVIGTSLWLSWPRGGGYAHCPGGGGITTGATIGGPFELTDHNGARVTSAQVIDQPSLVYFGYTFCPDFCPTDAYMMAQATDLLEESGHTVKPIFITIDPARDTVETMASYVDAFHPRMVGLTGSEEDVAAAAGAYRVYRQKASDDAEDYLMDHSTFTYLVDPQEGFLTVFRHNTPPEEVAKATSCFIEAKPG